MKKYILIPCLIACAIVGCRHVPELIEISYDKELIPEGIAISSETNKIYLSSIFKDKIIVYDQTREISEDLFPTAKFGYKHGIGIEIKENLLFALGSSTVKGKSSSILLVYDLKKEELLKSYQLADTTSHFMNDLAVSNDLEVFITDTERNMVYSLKYPDGNIVPFLIDESLKYPNGIAISDDNSHLYVDSYSEGVRIVDINTNKIVNEKYAESSKMLAVDGLKYYKGDLYGIRNGDRDRSKHGFVKLELNDSGTDIDTILPLLMNHPKMNIPTTFCINEGHAYILANSQLENLDQENHRIINKDSLTNTFIIKLKL